MGIDEGTLTLIAAPTSEPITLDDAKDALRVDYDDDDVRITGLIKVARQFAEGFTNLYFFTQTLERTYRDFPAYKFGLNVWPLQSIDSVKYYDTSSPSAQQTLTVNTQYYADVTVIGGAVEAYDAWPAVYDKPNAVAIRMTAGYSDIDDIPEDIKEGLRAYLHVLYHGDMAMEQVAKNLWWPHRRL